MEKPNYQPKIPTGIQLSFGFSPILPKQKHVWSPKFTSAHHRWQILASLCSRSKATTQTGENKGSGTAGVSCGGRRRLSQDQSGYLIQVTAPWVARSPPAPDEHSLRLPHETLSL